MGPAPPYQPSTYYLLVALGPVHTWARDQHSSLDKLTVKIVLVVNTGLKEESFFRAKEYPVSNVKPLGPKEALFLESCINHQDDRPL